MKVIFVGVHNKEPFMPLDSKSRSGSLVDRVVEKINCNNVVKSNLFETTYTPSDAKEIEELIYEWVQKYQPSSYDVIVLLGGTVQKHFPNCNGLKVRYGHPSPMFRKEQSEEYIINLSEKINDALLKSTSLQTTTISQQKEDVPNTDAEKKAQDLIDKFYAINPNNGNESAKQCALIAVDFAIDFLIEQDIKDKNAHFLNSIEMRRLENIKQSISKL